MTLARVLKVENRLAKLARAPGGKTVEEAVTSAEQRIESVRERCVAALALKAEQLATLAAGDRGEAASETLDGLYNLSNAIFGVAGVYELDALAEAACSLCDLLHGFREAGWRFLVASVCHSEADDCFQETFVSALRAYPRLDEDSNLRAWVLTIAHRKALDAHRGRARRAIPVADMGATDPRATPSPPARHQALWDAVGELPARQRSAVVLRYVGDLPHRDIAAAIGCSEEAARRSLHEGLTKLRKVVPT